MAFFSSVPVVDVHRENFKSIWPSLILAIKSSSYIAVDAELSGLGNRKNLLSRSMEDRYQSLADVAKTRSVLSLGISCFKARGHLGGSQSTPNTVNLALGFLVQTFNITTLCSENYTVEPGSLKFLVDHGFDFNKQYAFGVPYHRGVDKDGEDKEDAQTLRALFSELIRGAKPIVFHNGLVDLVFLYQNFYTELPATSSQFTADLCEIFPGGIFDTKYLAEFEVRMQASYLEYAFRKSQRENARLASSSRQHVALEFCQYDEDAPFVGYHQCSLPPSFIDQSGSTREETKQAVELCETYAAHGHCKDGIWCSKSHDPDAIQDADDDREERKRKRKRRRHKHLETPSGSGPPDCKKDKEDETKGCHGDVQMDKKDAVDQEDETDDKMAEVGNVEESQKSISTNAMNKHSDTGMTEDRNGGSGSTRGTVEPETVPSLSLSSRTSPQKSTKQPGSHRAGYDAFMTGFVMATIASTLSSRSTPQPPVTDRSQEFVEAFHLAEFRNRLFLSAKPVPLLIAKSGFTKTSQHHRDKMKRLAITPT